MSYQLLKADVLFYQRLLKANGFYQGSLNGLWDAATDAADDAFLQESENIKNIHGVFDVRSEANIITLAPKVQALARKFLAIMKNNSLDVRIISGTRTYAEQDALYRKGRFGSTEKKVTNARGGFSNHNFGLAWDIGLFEAGKYITDNKKYKQVAPLALTVLPELEWGGSWVSFPDTPHYQHKTSVGSVSAIRELFEKGKTYLQ
jgi:peptidoglycan L-alanyl-D-glutamate endopeptidase CwlK